MAALKDAQLQRDKLKQNEISTKTNLLFMNNFM